MKKFTGNSNPILLVAAIGTVLSLWGSCDLLPTAHAQRAAVSITSQLMNDKTNPSSGSSGGNGSGGSGRHKKQRKWNFFKNMGNDLPNMVEQEDESSSSEGKWFDMMMKTMMIGLTSMILFVATQRGEKIKQEIEELIDTGKEEKKKKKKKEVVKSSDSTVSTLSLCSEEFLMDDGQTPDFLTQSELGFEDVKMVLKQKGKKPDRIILDGSFKGTARPGRMLAIMGPSGSGKSSLIHAIAGRIKASDKITLSGNRYINEQMIAGDSNIPAAFIEQESNFFPHMTVKETLDFRVELKLGSQFRKVQRDDIVSNLMDMLGLTKSADTIVGNSKVRGLSGGERKRLSIACEMISSPPILILDEPTSGLDSYQATQVIEYLRKLADSGKTVIAVIHQPSQRVFSLFDDLVLVSEGRMLYNGEVKGVRSYLQKLGFEAASDTGTAEHILECISPTTNGGPETEKTSNQRLDKLASEASHISRSLSVGGNKDHEKKLKIVTASKKAGPNGLRQFKLLLGRAFKELKRGKATIVIKVVQQVTLGVIYGGIYKLGDNQGSVMDRFGLISLVTIGTLNMAMASTIRSFTKEKSIVSPEMAGGMYNTFPYFLAKALSEIPIEGVYNAIFGAIIYPMTGLQKGKFSGFFSLVAMHTLVCQAVGLIIGSIAPTTDVALSLFPPIVVLNLIFDGRNISIENTPRLFRWLPKVGVVKWAFQGLAINEFTGLSFSAAGPRRGPLIKNGEEALEKFGLANMSIREVFTAQRNILGVCWLLSYLSLSLTKQKYEKMLAP